MDIAPKLHEQYAKMLQYLSEETTLKFEFVYCSSYEELFNKLQKNEVDMAELGPLPYLKLSTKMPHLKPIVTFLTQAGEDAYTCKLFTYSKKDKKIEDFNPKETTLFLTSQHSTCGSLMMREILLKNGKSLEEFSNEYAQTHSNVVLQALLTPNSIGGIKSTVYKNYKHLGLTTLGTSQKIPGFTFAVNSNALSGATIQKIQTALTKLKPLTDAQDWQITKKWGKNIRYGAVVTPPNAYKTLIKVWQESNNAH